MLYVSYVAAVAIANVCIGLALANRMANARTAPNRESQDQLWEESPTDLLEASPMPISPDLWEATPTPMSPPNTTDSDPPTDTAARTPESNDGSFAGITTHVLARAESVQTLLESVLTRLTAAGNSRTPEEAQQLTQNVLATATTWLSDVEQAAPQLAASLKELPDAKTIHDKYERIMNEQLAQTETSMTNLSLLNWTSGTVYIDTSVTPELSRLIHSFADMRTKLQALVILAYELWSSINR